jgi:hypothetical protein
VDDYTTNPAIRARFTRSLRNFGLLGYEIAAIPGPDPLTRPAPACYQAIPDTWT